MWPLPMMHWTSLHRIPLDMGPSPTLVASGCHHWRPVQTCSLEALSHQHWNLAAATEVLTAGKRAVRIQLECFLVCQCDLHSASLYVLLRSCDKPGIRSAEYLWRLCVSICALLWRGPPGRINKCSRKRHLSWWRTFSARCEHVGLNIVLLRQISHFNK